MGSGNMEFFKCLGAVPLLSLLFYFYCILQHCVLSVFVFLRSSWKILCPSYPVIMPLSVVNTQLTVMVSSEDGLKEE